MGNRKHHLCYLFRIIPKPDVLSDYNPENKKQMINFMDVLNLCKGYDRVKKDIMSYDELQIKTADSACRKTGSCSKANQCLICCEYSQQHLNGIYKDVEILKKLGKEHQLNFIKGLFGENFTLPDVPVDTIAAFMNNLELPLPSEVGPNTYPYIFETDKQLSSIYNRYSRIFALLQYACDRKGKRISRNIIDEIFQNPTSQNLSYQQVVCGCNNIRWPLEENPTTYSCHPNGNKTSNETASKQIQHV